MSTLRRFAAALSGALLLQLTLLASGTLCTMHGTRGMEGPAAPHMMASMHSGAYESGASTRVGSSVSSVSGTESGPQHPGMPQGCDGSSERAGCGLPWAPGHCASMTTCATITASPSAELASHASTRAGSPAIATAVLFRSGPASAPELPPPRA